jgi:hypothetical protein
LVAGFAIAYAWYFALGSNTHKLPDAVQAILSHQGHGAILPEGSPLYYAPFVAAMVGSVGLLMMTRWGRTVLLASIASDVLLIPFAGVGVVAPFDALIGSIAWLLGAFILGVAYSPPIAAQLRRFGRKITEEDDFILQPQPTEKVVEVFSSGDESLLLVLESVLNEHGIPFSLAGENIQDLFAAGRLGGFNFAIGPARLFVREDDVPRVKDVLRELGVEDRVDR